ncbi:NmrA domain-containing protein [Mycena indigotica]|uniref:NmrA domain-containing protein n=1 Tax=Mycena indigotica TaxID=2126181 RepID=A0A8H6T3X8_9AGAR|nr:NmrA domain-containing protein [Mycena indigotica]KAF7309892.1 NmrA domain-containing protein [Mycena indigotica]
MSPRYNNVIVFGPTGDIGGLVALEANRRGAKVWLAMRDITKAIGAIPAEVEKSGNFTRIQADLSDPVSTSKAISQSGAKSAYLYLVYTPDFARATLQAMRDAGVEHVVFLSSYTIGIGGLALRDISPKDSIPYAHAQVEINIEEIGFPYFTALRPGWFASNFFRAWFDDQATPPKALIVAEESVLDNITPEDIALVGGAVLVEGPSDGKETIYLYGPERLTIKDSWDIIKKVTGRDIDTSLVTPERFTELLSAKHVPNPIIEYVLASFENTKTEYLVQEYQRDVGNVEKYSGRKPTKFADYIAAHKAEWVA